MVTYPWHWKNLEEEERFFREIYQTKNVCPESVNLEPFCDGILLNRKKRTPAKGY